MFPTKPAALLCATCTALLVTVISTVALSTTAQTSSATDWDFFVLDMLWKPVYPSDAKGTLPKAAFGIHGLWPSNSQGANPAFCNKQMPFNPGPLAPIFNKLNIEWQDSCNPANGSGFWSHEWNKHGTCAISNHPNITDEYSYFDTTLNAFTLLNPRAVLDRAGVGPDKHAYVDGSDLVTISNRSLKGGIFKCKQSNKNYVISELLVCLDRDLNLITCPPATIRRASSRACPTDVPVYYAPASHVPCPTDMPVY